MKCKHELVDVKDGTLDKLCLKCEKKAMQGQLRMSAQASIGASIIEPRARKEVIIPLYTGDKTVNIKVYEDEVKKSIMKKLGIPGMNMNNRR